VLAAMLSDLETGLLGRLDQRAAGEISSDMLVLAKEALREKYDAAIEVAAVTYELPAGVRPSDRREVSINRPGATLRAPTRVRAR